MMTDAWEYKGCTYDLDPAKIWEAGGVLWSYSGRRDHALGIPLMTPRMPGQGYPIGPDRLFSSVIDLAGDVREFGGDA
jgi:hypothetical protein